jgi:hypothetical protein
LNLKPNQQDDNQQEKYSSSLFVLRSAHLLWERQEFQDRYRHKSLTTQTANEPWNTHQLYLHCAIETDLLTSNAAKLDIAVEMGALPSPGTPPLQATEIAMSAYNSRKHGKR